MPCILLRLVATVHRTLNWWIIIISIVWIRVWKESYIDIRENPIFVFLFLLLWLLEGHSCQMLHHIALDLFLLFIWWAGRSGSILQKQRRLLQHNTILLKKMRREQQQQLAVYIGRSKLHVPLPPSYALLGSISFFFFFFYTIFRPYEPLDFIIYIRMGTIFLSRPRTPFSFGFLLEAPGWQWCTHL